MSDSELAILLQTVELAQATERYAPNLGNASEGFSSLNLVVADGGCFVFIIVVRAGYVVASLTLASVERIGVGHDVLSWEIKQ